MKILISKFKNVFSKKNSLQHFIGGINAIFSRPKVAKFIKICKKYLLTLKK
jgi:hypothetical protein